MQHVDDPYATVLDTVTYTYDSFNRMVARIYVRTVDNGYGPDIDYDVSTQEVFVYDGGQMVSRYSAVYGTSTDSSYLKTRYLWGPGVDMLLAQEDVIYNYPLATTNWALTDHQGTVRDWLNYTVDHVAYDSFGNQLNAPTSLETFIGYTGKYVDPVTDLQWNLNRWYDSHQGRWMSEDPIGFSGDLSNVYRYVGNSPTNWIDPSGLFGPIVYFVGGFAAGFAIGYLTDWDAEWLSADESSYVNMMLGDLRQAAKEANDAEVIANLDAMTIKSRFKPGAMPDPGTSETRNGRCFGYRSRTILSNDFFSRMRGNDRDRMAQYETLLHESYHAGTEDWTENRSYSYAREKLDKLKQRLGIIQWERNRH